MNRSIVPVLLLTVAMSACNRAEDAPGAADTPPAAPEAAAAKEARGAVGADNATTPVPAERKLIQTAELNVEVASYEDARRALDRELARAGGFVADANVEHHDGEVSRAELTLRIPAKQLASFLSDAAGYGTVLHEALHTEDITGSYVDLEARLRNARRLEARLLELMAAKTDGVQQLLEVERELARVREQIERFDGQIKGFDERMALSTVKMQLTTRRVYTAATEPTLGERMMHTLSSSWSSLTTFGRGLLLVATALVPWLLPLALVAWGLRLLVRRVRRRFSTAQQHAAQ